MLNSNAISPKFNPFFVNTVTQADNRDTAIQLLTAAFNTFCYL